MIPANNIVSAKPIAFVDSGIGGLPYLSYARDLLPGAPLIYAADNRGFPYGTKSPEEITASFSAMIEAVIREADPQLFVVACNTASIIALEHLRRTYPYHFVGVVPAIKPAAALTKTKSIGILATQRTIGDPYIDRLAADYAADCRLTRLAATELINQIERDPFVVDEDRFKTLIAAIALELEQAQVDVLVLGCTHFLHIESLFLSQMSRVRVLDSRDGVARQTQKIARNLQKGSVAVTALSTFYLTAEPANPELYERVAKQYGLEYRGVVGG